MLTTANLSLNRTIKENGNGQSLFPLRNMIRDIASEVRKTSHNLMPNTLSHHRLGETLLLYTSGISSSGELQVDLQALGDLNILEKPTELLLYRIAQELIQNVIKHAQASYAVLQLVQKERQISLSIEDDGIGFDETEEHTGFGLQNLRYRVQALQGYLSIQSELGKGTTVYIEFNLDKLAEIN